MDLDRLIEFKYAVKASGHTPENPRFETPSEVVVYQTIFNGTTDIIPHPDFSPSLNRLSIYALDETWDYE